MDMIRRCGKKIREIIGGAMLVAGIAIAIVTPDGCEHEVLWRLGGLVMLLVGGLVARKFDFQH